MNLPTKITVSGIDYAVREKEYVEINENKNYQGACVYSTPTIEVLKALGDERKAEVLVHEMMHAILFEAGFSEHDEDQVNRSAKVLYQVLRDNNFGFIREVTE